MIEALAELYSGEYWTTRFVFRRLLALIYGVAFLVAANQWKGLVGDGGLLPARQLLDRVSWKEAPGLFQIRYSDGLAVGLAWTGVALSVLAFTTLPARAGTIPSMAVWGALWLLYLSFVNAGRVFYGFGWESLLLETGFLAIFLGGWAVEPPELVIWLLRWVLFRNMFGAGLIKMRGDSCWRELTCLHYHHETQPLPNPLSPWFHRLPGPVLEGGVAVTHFVQLVVPFFYFAPAPVSWIAGALTIGFQATLILSGNLSWLNYLTIALAVSCFGDTALGTVVPVEAPALAARALPYEVALWGLGLLVAALSVNPVRNMLSSRQAMNASFDPLHLVNTYGAFGSVTRARREIVIEGTRSETDGPGTEWRAYEFKGKPGDPERRPPWVAPYHWRLDWQMWFAAMGPPTRHPWILVLVARLLEGREEVLDLLAENPFPEEPPARIRARLYTYRFTDPEERRRTGRWWDRTLEGEYLPPVGAGDELARQVLGPGY